MKGDACNWSPRYVDDTDKAYTVVWLMGRDDGNGVVKQTHVFATDSMSARDSVYASELKSCEGRVLSVLSGHLRGGE